MLINDFYACHDMAKLENELSCRIVFNPDHAIFKGHFPGQPVVPGVCMMEIVKELLQDRFDRRMRLLEARNVKFLGFITPDMQPTAHISWKQNNDIYTVTASFRSGDLVLFKLDGNYCAILTKAEDAFI